MSDVYAALRPFKENPMRTGIFSDLDGTLSKIVETPSSALVTEDIREALKRLTEKYKIVGVVSGRDSNNAKSIVNLDGIVYVGNHGLEWLENDRQLYADEAFNYTGLMDSLAAKVRQLLKDTEIIVEHKKLAVALHYRLAEDKEGAREIIEHTVNQLISRYPLLRAEGKYVVELKPDLPINKGDALTALVISKGLDNALYLGDDITDIHAFRALRTLEKEGRLRGVSVAVVSDEAPPGIKEEADYLVSNVDEVGSLLRWLGSAESPR